VSPSPQRILDTLQAYREAAVLHTAIELELFTRIAHGMDTAYKVASSLELPVRGVKLVCESLAVSGFLIKEDDRYRLSEDAAWFLDRKSAGYLDGTAALYSPELRRAYEGLTETVRAGKVAPGAIAETRPAWFAAGRGVVDAAAAGKAFADAVNLPAGERIKILDIASRDSMYSIGLALRYPDAIVVALDCPKALGEAQARANAARLGTRYQNIPGDPLTAPLGFDYDVVLLSHLYQFEPEQVISLLARIQYALKKKTGQLLIVEFFEDNAFAGFRMNMFAGTARGELYTEGAVREILGTCGFGSIEVEGLEGSRASLVRARL
jgi:hypothetical protein